MKKPALLLLLSSSLLLTGCSTTLAAAGITVAAVGGYFLGQDKRNLQTISQDAEIRGQISSAYFAEPLINAMQIHIKVRNGVVVLTGTVASEGIAQRAVQLAQQTRGTHKVITRLKVVPPDQYLVGVEHD